MTIYSDLNYMKPSKGDLLYDVDDIYQAIFSLIGTKKGERVFRPTWGANFKRYLFEPCDDITASNIMYDLINTLTLEPRVKLNTSRTRVIPDPLNRRFLITLVFEIVGRSGSRSIDLSLSQT